MSVFAGKTILVVGDETNQVHDIERELELRGSNIIRATCSLDTLPESDLLNIDVALLNHLHDGSACINLLTLLGNFKLSRKIPIFALVSNNQQSIEEALNLGAADYFSQNEKIESVIKKMSIALGEPDVSGRSVIEINESKVRSGREGVRVYVIEDDPLLGNLLTMRLEQAKFDFRIDSSGHDAISEIKLFEPDVVVLDLSLPKQSGFDILQSFRNETELKDLPVIVFSNRDSDDDKERAKSLGVKTFFTKVMTDFPDLITEIERLA